MRNRYKITVRGDARACIDNAPYDDEGSPWCEYPVLEGAKLKKLDGVTCDTCFSDYVDSDMAKYLSGGWMRFEWDPASEQLMTVVEYESSKFLKSDLLAEVLSYTQGQWSDGIGEGFEQTPAVQIDGCDVYISPWHDDQEIKIRSVKVKDEENSS